MWASGANVTYMMAHWYEAYGYFWYALRAKILPGMADGQCL